VSVFLPKNTPKTRIKLKKVLKSTLLDPKTLLNLKKKKRKKKRIKKNLTEVSVKLKKKVKKKSFIKKD